MVDAKGDNEEPDIVLGRRVERLEALARELTAADLLSIAKVIDQSDTRTAPWAPSERYWFSGHGGATLGAPENRAIRTLWTRLQAAVTMAVTGVDLDRDVEKSGVVAILDRLFEPSRDHRIEGKAAALLERRVGAGVWDSVIGVWNAFCAALLSEKLDPALRASLEAPWRTVLGRTPRETLGIGDPSEPEGGSPR